MSVLKIYFAVLFLDKNIKHDVCRDALCFCIIAMYLFVFIYFYIIFSVFASRCSSADPLSLKSAADNPVSTLVVSKPEFSWMNTFFSWMCLILNGIVIFADAYLRAVTASPCGGVSALRLCSLSESWLTLHRNERHVRRRLRNISVTRIRHLLEARTSMNADSPSASVSHTHTHAHTNKMLQHNTSSICSVSQRAKQTNNEAFKWQVRKRRRRRAGSQREEHACLFAVCLRGKYYKKQIVWNTAISL